MIGNLEYTIELLKKHGWVEYEGGTWIRKEWIENRQPYDRMAVDIQTAIDLTLPKNMENKNEESKWVSTDGKPIEEVLNGMKNLGDMMNKMPDPSKMDEQVKKVEEVIKNVSPTNDFDDSDIALIRILKNKLVRKQLYDLAAQLRDIEKNIMLIIDEQDRKRQDGKEFEYKESIAFGEFLLRNFTACHWYDDRGGTIDKNMKIFGYVKNDDPSDKTYSNEQVFQLFQLERMKENLKGD